MNTSDYIKNIGNIVGEILSESGQDERTTRDFLGFLNALVAKNVPILRNEVLLRAISGAMTRFIEDRKICSEGLKFLSSNAPSKKGKKKKETINISAFTFTLATFTR